MCIRKDDLVSNSITYLQDNSVLALAPLTILSRYPLAIMWPKISILHEKIQACKCLFLSQTSSWHSWVNHSRFKLKLPVQFVEVSKQTFNWHGRKKIIWQSPPDRSILNCFIRSLQYIRVNEWKAFSQLPWGDGLIDFIDRFQDQDKEVPWIDILHKGV